MIIRVGLSSDSESEEMHLTDLGIKLPEQILESSALSDYLRKGRPCQGVSPLRLQDSGYFVRVIPPTPKKQKPQRRCVVCKAKNKMSEGRYECKECLVAYSGLL